MNTNYCISAQITQEQRKVLESIIEKKSKAEGRTVKIVELIKSSLYAQYPELLEVCNTQK